MQVGLGEGQRIVFAPFTHGPLVGHGLGGIHLQEESQVRIAGC